MELKQYVDKGLLPITRKVTISPDVITLMSMLVMVGAAWFAVTDMLLWAGLLILASGVLDMLDGAVARATGRTTRFGALFDRVADRFGDYVILAAIILGGHVEPVLGLYVLLTVSLASYISACLEAATSSTIGCRISLRALRIVILALACISGLVVEGMILLAVIGTWTVISRLCLSRRLLY